MWINVLMCYTKIQVSCIYILSPVSGGGCWGRSDKILNQGIAPKRLYLLKLFRVVSLEWQASLKVNVTYLIFLQADV